MKKIIIVTLFLLTLGISNLYSQKAQNRIKTNVLGLFTLFYENQVSDKISLQVGLQYNPKNLPAKNSIVKSIAPEIRYYLKSFNERGGGIFGAIYTKLSDSELTNSHEHIAKINAIATGLDVGYLYILKNNFIAEVFAGAGYNVYKKIDTNFSNEFPKKNYKFDIRIGIGLGYSF